METYRYVGSKVILEQADLEIGGRLIMDLQAVTNWATERVSDSVNGRLTATFVIDANMNLVLNGRHSEHVTCAKGKEVFAAGELILERDNDGIYISEITNQSTGYCPKPESWVAVKLALDKIGIRSPDGFTNLFEFRYCDKCESINLIKDHVFECAVCDSMLDTEWNFDKRR